MSSDLPLQQSLLKRGKRAVAVNVRNELGLPSGRKQLEDLLNYFLDPKKVLDFEAADWCKWLIAGGLSFDEFADAVRRYDSASVCGLVWTADFIAYRCRTCGLSPCMSLCPDCFYGGNHEGHDFNMFRSHAGGACDCGDANVMNREGFCRKHGRRDDSPKVSVPRDLIGMAQVVVPRLVVRLLYYLRDKYSEYSARNGALSGTVTLDDCEHFLNLLHELSSTGSVMWDLLADSLCDVDLYSDATSVSDPSVAWRVNSRDTYQAAMQASQPEAEMTSFVLRGTSVDMFLQPHCCVLAEITFWMVIYEFPEKLTTWLLGMLPNSKFKMSFTEAFVDHYALVSRSLLACTSSESRDRFANKVVHVSVQLFSNEMYAVRMAQSRRLLQLMVASLHSMLNKCLVQSGIHAIPGSNAHYVLDCAHDAVREHCYWPLISDLVNVLSHRIVSEMFLTDESLLSAWFGILSFLQGMNLNERELNHHVEYETDTYMAAFSAELEISCSPLVRLLHATKQHHMTVVLAQLKSALDHWFDDVGISFCTVPNRHQMSFHFPLHRYFAALLCHSIRTGTSVAMDAYFEPGFLKRLMIHPLHLQVAVSEINANMWVRNGFQMKCQVSSYMQSHFCNPLVDLDLYLLQVCCAHMDVDVFVRMVIDRYHVAHWLSLWDPLQPQESSFGDAAQDVMMLEDCLVLLTRIITSRTSVGLTDTEVVRKELVAQLCLADRTHSQICGAVPDKLGMQFPPAEMEDQLKEIADFKAPCFDATGKLQQGTYYPKCNVWTTEFDPIYSMLRNVQRQQFQITMDRYTEHMVRLGKAAPGDCLWPPLRFPTEPAEPYKGIVGLLRSKMLLALIFAVLYKRLQSGVSPRHGAPGVASHDHARQSDPADMGQASAVSDTTVCFAVYLLHLMVVEASAGDVKMSKGETRGYQEWFPYDDLDANLAHVVSAKQGDSEHTERNQTDDGMDVDDSSSPAAFPELMKVSGVTESTVPLNRPGERATFPHMVTSARLHARNPGCSLGLQRTTGHSVVTLLLKVHDSLRMRDESSYNPSAATAAAGAAGAERIGTGCSYIAQLLDVIRAAYSRCALVIDSMCKQRQQASSVLGGAAEDDDSHVTRRRKAKERQQRLLEKMARQQRRFLQATGVTIAEAATSTEAASPPGGGSSSLQASSMEHMASTASISESYECAICGTTSTSTTTERPMGLIIYAQPTSVLGYMRCSAHLCHLPVYETMTGLSRETLLEDYYNKRKQLITKYCMSPLAFAAAIGMSEKSGVCMQSCGHYLHLDCHASYVESVKSQPRLRQSLADHEYMCPMCRQLANAILPVPPSASLQPSATGSLASTGEKAMLEVSELLASSSTATWYDVPTNKSNAYIRSIHRLWSDLSTSAFVDECLQLSRQGSCIFHQLIGIARSNLELDNLYRKTAISIPSRRTGLGLLLDALNLLAKVIAGNASANFPQGAGGFPPSPAANWKIASETWAQLTGYRASAPSSDSSVVLAKRNMPLLLREPAVVLLELLLSMPLPMQKGHFECIVRAAYQLAYTQSAINVSCKLSEDERYAWLKEAGSSRSSEGGDSSSGSGTTASPWCGQPILSKIIALLKDSALYLADNSMELFLHSVWSPQSVATAIQDGCLSFLETAAHIKKSIYLVDIPQIQEHEHSSIVLCRYLNLSPSLSSSGSDGGSSPAMAWQPDSAATMWPGSSVKDSLLASWCQALKLAIKTDADTARTLVSYVTRWHPPHLMALPHEYDVIFQYYRKKKCTKCHSVPELPAVCLICGQFVGFKNLCCSASGAVIHAKACGSGTCVLLDVNRCQVVIIRGPRATLWGSVYLDEHGEEDRDLLRGKPLYLCHHRYKMLEEQWLSHNFDLVCKRWMLHQDEL